MRNPRAIHEQMSHQELETILAELEDQGLIEVVYDDDALPRFEPKAKTMRAGTG